MLRWAHLSFLAGPMLLAGCGANAPPAPAAVAQKAKAAKAAAKPEPALPPLSMARAESEANNKSRPDEPLPPSAESQHGWMPLPKPVIDDRKAELAGIRKLVGKRLVLYTDLASRPEIDGLCHLADQAWPHWRRYFQLDPDNESPWQIIGYLMGDKRKFQAAGLLPDSLPEFAYGYCRDHEFWLYDQPADYYRRHLLLHEMTHSFMLTQVRVLTPAWYMEGIAELLATHRLRDDKLEMNYFPQRKEETPDWGRIKLIHEGFAEGKALYLSQVIELPPEAHLRVENYAWCWGVAAFLDGHPRYRERFRQVARDVAQPEFNTRFRQLFEEDWAELEEEWQLFVGTIEYGYDRQRAAIEFGEGKDLSPDGANVTIAAARGWQSSELRLSAGKRYRLRAHGRYEVAQDPQPWVSEANGVSIRYYKRLPLGMLIAAVRPDQGAPNNVSSLFRTASIGLDRTITPEVDGTLYLRINDSNAELADNRGELTVEVVPQP